MSKSISWKHSIWINLSNSWQNHVDPPILLELVWEVYLQADELVRIAMYQYIWSNSLLQSKMNLFQENVVRILIPIFFCIFTLKTLIISVAPLLALWYQLRPRCWYVKNSSCKVVPRNLEIPEIGLNCVKKVPHVTVSQSFRN